jgi:peptidoglycan/xylan/chitin deacetylase (PgdA/CDA1 family)
VPYYVIPPAARKPLRRMLRMASDARAALRRTRDFPAWPIEASLDVLRWHVWLRAARTAGVHLDLRPYPGRKKFAAVLTHDVESAGGLENVAAFRKIERQFGVASAWSIISDRYQTDDGLLRALIDEGCEILSHGHTHDGKLAYLSDGEIQRRLLHIFEKKPWLKRHISGFRSGLLLRSHRLSENVSELFEYDLTRPDTEKYGTNRRTAGCATIFPFFNRFGTLEIPLTMPQDVDLLHVRTLTPGEALELWKRKVDYISALRGIVVFNVHPDPPISGNEQGREIYRELIEFLVEKGAWIATPRDLHGLVVERFSFLGIERSGASGLRRLA